jgi:cell wall-associated NlpC family hydrolase
MSEAVERLIREARHWIGRPFLHQGQTWDGVDCVGLIVALCKSENLIPPDFSTGIYGRIPSNDMLTERIAEHCERLETPIAGSLVVIRWTREASHVALCTGETLIHSYESMGRVVEHGYRGRWLRMTASAWKLPGLAYE